MEIVRRAVLSAMFVLIAIMPAAAWDSGGHELIATLAYARLNPKAQKAVNDLAREMVNPDQTYDAVTLACWMDDLRHNPAMPYHGIFLSWHFIDIGIDPGGPAPSFEPGDDNEMHGNVVQALKRAMVVLQGGSDPYVKSKAMACAMVMHLVGDIHQPLHCATKYFYSYGQERQDYGGNKEDVINGPPGDPKFNLHAFWDSAWRASFDTASGCVVLDTAPDPFGRNVMALRNGRIATAAELEPNFDAWARESNAIAREFAYPGITATDNKKYCRLSSEYVAKSNAIANGRLALAAWRLAALLNNTLGAEIPAKTPPSYPAGPPSQGY